MGGAGTERSPAVRAEELVERRALVVDVVLDILTRRGYDGVVVREVSRRSRVSSKTIYKLFETREHMIVAALERWMVTNVYVKVVLPEPDESLYDVLMRFLRAMFEPWERNPRMLEAYHRATAGPGRGAPAGTGDDGRATGRAGLAHRRRRVRGGSRRDHAQRLGRSHQPIRARRDRRGGHRAETRGRRRPIDQNAHDE